MVSLGPLLGVCGGVQNPVSRADDALRTRLCSRQSGKVRKDFDIEPKSVLLQLSFRMRG